MKRYDLFFAHIDSSTYLLLSLYSPWSDSHAKWGLSGLALTNYICSSTQVAQVAVEVEDQGHEKF